MTALEEINEWINQIHDDMEVRGTAAYHSVGVYDRLKDLRAIMQIEAQKNIPPHPLPPSPAAKQFAQQLITKVMPIRDQIACMAMQGFLAADKEQVAPDDVAGFSYSVADAMIKEGNIQV